MTQIHEVRRVWEGLDLIRISYLMADMEKRKII